MKIGFVTKMCFYKFLQPPVRSATPSLLTPALVREATLDSIEKLKTQSGEKLDSIEKVKTLSAEISSANTQRLHNCKQIGKEEGERKRRNERQEILD